jgi:CelD/BcsL family acetyltransferase involved in cellulose biosynthesis
MTNTIRFAMKSTVSVENAAALWLHLEQESAPSFFTSWKWIGNWLRCLPPHVRPQLLIAERGDRVVGAAFLVSRQEWRRGILKVRQWHFNATGEPSLDCLTIEHNGFLSAANEKMALWPAFLRWFAQQRNVDELVLPGAVDGEVGDVPADTRLLHRKTSSPAFMRRLGQGGVDEILAGLSRNSRQQLRRNLRDWQKEGVLSCTVADSVETALQWFDALKALHIRSWDDRRRPHGFRYPFVDKFHGALITNGTGCNTELVEVRAGPSPIGYLYNFRNGETVLAYQSGFDYSQADRRPGYVSHLLAMAKSAESGMRTYDFLAGDNQLKRTLGDVSYVICSHVFAQPRLGLRMEAAARDILNYARAGKNRKERE